VYICHEFLIIGTPHSFINLPKIPPRKAKMNRDCEGQDNAVANFLAKFYHNDLFFDRLFFKYLPPLVLIGFVGRGAFKLSFLRFKKLARSWQKIFMSLSSKYF
jgi:hypothetical protein